MNNPLIDFKYLDSSDQLDEIFSLEKSGKLNEATKLLKKTLVQYCSDKNAKKIQEVLIGVKSRKAYHAMYTQYQVYSDIITGDLNINSISKMRENYFQFENEQKSLNLYQEVLLRIFKDFSGHLEIIKNEIQLVSFIEKVIGFDDLSKSLNEPKVMDFKKNWIIKQLALFSRCDVVLNYAALALIHSSDTHTSKLLYRYMVSNKILVSRRLKYWIGVKGWEVENLYKKEILDDPTQVFEGEISKLKIDELLSQSETPFLQRNEYEEILNSYQISIKDINDNKRSDLEQHLIISYGDQGIVSRVNFYLENAFYKEAFKLISEQIEYAKQHDSLDLSENLNWFYLALLALLMKNDYNEAIKFTNEYEHHWKLLGVRAVDLWYLSAEANFYSGHFEKAQQYYQRINKLSPDYRLTKGRLEEIKAHK